MRPEVVGGVTTDFLGQKNIQRTRPFCDGCVRLRILVTNKPVNLFMGPSKDFEFSLSGFDRKDTPGRPKTDPARGLQTSQDIGTAFGASPESVFYRSFPRR